MKHTLLMLGFLGTALALDVLSADVAAQEKRKTGTILGFVTDKGNSKAMNNAWVEIKADGEEKGRRYWPAADRKIGGPDREILAAIRAVAIGARVQIEWIDAGDGKDITKFQVLKPAK